MSEANASGEQQRDTLASDPEHRDLHTESLTDLIDTLQRQSFIRRFELQAAGDAEDTELRVLGSRLRPLTPAGRSG